MEKAQAVADPLTDLQEDQVEADQTEADQAEAVQLTEMVIAVVQVVIQIIPWI